jgi:hypothetical protein
MMADPSPASTKPICVSRRLTVWFFYDGVVITEAGSDPKVAGLVYVSAFEPDGGESVETPIANPAPGAAAVDPAAQRRVIDWGFTVGLARLLILMVYGSPLWS